MSAPATRGSLILRKARGLSDLRNGLLCGDKQQCPCSAQMRLTQQGLDNWELLLL